MYICSVIALNDLISLSVSSDGCFYINIIEEDMACSIYRVSAVEAELE